MSTTCDATNHGTWKAYKSFGCTGDDVAILAGTTPKQRREMRRQADERARQAMAA